MAKYVEAETLAEKLRRSTPEVETYYESGFIDAMDLAKKFIDNMDGVEIVRCKDCKYYHSVTAQCEVRGKGLYLIRGNEDYCSRAERRGNG